MSRTWPIAVFSIALLAAVNARAQTIAVNNTAFGNGPYTVGSYTLAFSSCQYYLNGTLQSSCSGDNLDISASVSGSGKTLTLTYLNATSSSSPILSQASSDGCTCVYYDLTVTTSTIPISKAVANLTGVNDGGTGANINNEFDLTSGSGKYSAALTAPTTATSATSSYTLSSPTNSLSIDMSIGLNSVYNGSTFSLNTATVSIVETPEPASLLLLFTGVAGVGAARRMRRRSRLSATAGTT